MASQIRRGKRTFAVGEQAGGTEGAETRYKSINSGCVSMRRGNLVTGLRLYELTAKAKIL